jgi:hypothetical protein
MLALAGLGYITILDKDLPNSFYEVVFRIFCEILIASLVCLAGLAGLFTIYRGKSNRLLEECRQLVRRLLESKLDKSHSATRPASQRESDNRETFQRAAETSG